MPHNGLRSFNAACSARHTPACPWRNTTSGVTTRRDPAACQQSYERCCTLEEAWYSGVHEEADETHRVMRQACMHMHMQAHTRALAIQADT